MLHLFRRIKMLDAIFYFRFFGVVEAIQGADQITGDAADPFEGNITFPTAAVGTLVTDDAGITADRIAIDRVIDGASI